MSSGPVGEDPRPVVRHSASEIAPGVYVGGKLDAPHFEGVRLCVSDEAPPEARRARHFPVYDGEGDRPNMANLERLVEAIATARSRGEPVLVFCGHGVRRGPLGGAWYLHRTERISLDAAYDRIERVRPQIERATEWIGNASDLDPPRGRRDHRSG